MTTISNISKTDDQNFFLKRSTIYLILSHFIIVLIFAFTRLVDGDEGFYLIAAQEVWNGRTLYLDFFYPQMPYLPYFFSLISGHGFTTLFIARLIGAVFSLFTIILFTRIVCKITVNNSVRTALLFLYAFNALIIIWHPTAKTYMFTDFFLMFSFLSFLYYLQTKSTKMLIATAISIALAVNFRSVFAPLIIFYAVLFFFNSNTNKIKNITTFLISVIVVSIPTIYLMILSPDHFFFDNFGFHTMRADWMTIGDGLANRLITIGKIIVNPQIVVILLVLISYQLCKRKSVDKNISNFKWYQSPSKLAGIMAVIITFIYLLPKPILQQYFLQVIPFALFASIKGLEFFFSESKMKFWNKSRNSITKTAFTVYILGILPYIFVFILGVREQDGSQNLRNMHQMCSYIQKESTSKLILAEWPAIPLLAEVSNLDGLEFLGFEFPLPLTPEESRKYHLALDNEIRDNIVKHKPDFIIVKYDPALPLRPVINELYNPDTS
ncbi:MAG: hypothetical protein ABIJ12_03915, partial [bacterium]